MTVINGTNGADNLSTLESGDIVYGLSGSDIISDNFGAATVYGGNSGDVINGSVGSNVFYGQDGNDTINTGGDHNTVFGGKGADSITGSGNDTLFGNTGNDTISSGHTGSSYISGDDGNDLLYGNGLHDTLLGGTGNDTIYGGAGNSLIYGNTGADNLVGVSGQDTLVGGSGNDTVTGGTGHSVLFGNTGSDILIGNSGQDTLVGGDGGDFLVVTHGNNLLIGDSTTLYPSGDTNLIVNGNFNNLAGGTLVHENGSYDTWTSIPGWYSTVGAGIEIDRNSVVGIAPTPGSNESVELDSDNNSNMIQNVATNGTGTFHLSFEYSARPGTDAATNGIEVIWNGAVIDTISGNTPGWSTHSYNLVGSSTAATTQLEFLAVGTSDSVGGLLDNVQLVSGVYGPGNDTLIGGSGNDTLIGGPGDNIMTAGTGNTLFIYNVSNDANDKIHGFNANDTLQLNNGNVFAMQSATHFTSDGHGNTLVTFDFDSNKITLTGVAPSLVEAHTTFN